MTRPPSRPRVSPVPPEVDPAFLPPVIPLPALSRMDCTLLPVISHRSSMAGHWNSTASHLAAAQEGIAAPAAASVRPSAEVTRPSTSDGCAVKQNLSNSLESPLAREIRQSVWMRVPARVEGISRRSSTAPQPSRLDLERWDSFLPCAFYL